eukprot:13839470-Alexandrium_andersonii.AAC.1
MSASLVGSEMCIRDSYTTSLPFLYLPFHSIQLTTEASSHHLYLNSPQPTTLPKQHLEFKQQLLQHTTHRRLHASQITYINS